MQSKSRRSDNHSIVTTTCRSSKNNNDDDISSSKQRASSSSSASARERGIYARPSGAIERGSGFFIPGLEGYKIRLLFGLVVLIVDALTAFTTTSSNGLPTILTITTTTYGVEDVGMIVSEALAAFYGLLLLLQGSIELAIETRGINIMDVGIVVESNDNDNNDDNNVDRNVNLFGIENNNNDSTNHYVDESSSESSSFDVAIQKMARAIIAFTPATDIQLVSEDLAVFYSFGSSSSSSVNDERQQGDGGGDENEEERKRLITLALDTILTNSRGGKFIALPSDHPSSKLIPNILARRCVLVQKMDDYHHPSLLPPLGVGESSGSRTCLIIGSDKLLQSYTKNDLRWIGQLAEYGNSMMMDSKVAKG
jgi:hypothetical protein